MPLEFVPLSPVLSPLTWCFDLSKRLILVALVPPQLNDQRLLSQVVQELHEGEGERER